MKLAGLLHNINLKHWILGFLLSFLIIWIISFLFVNTVFHYTWSPETGTWIHPPESIHRHRSEGWATSHFGQWDIIGIDDISKIKIPTIAIWGDSHVEAFQIEQREKMQEVLVGKWKDDGINLTAFGIGQSGESIADYYFKIPRYEKICPAIIAHYIIICDDTEALPDQPSAGHASFQANPDYRIIDINKEPDHMRIRTVLRKYGLDFLWSSAVTVFKGTKLRFFLGPRKTELLSLEVAHETQPEKAFSFLLHALTNQTTKPIVFVYCPHVPAIKGGKVHFKDPNADIVSVFARECRRNGIGFIDMTQEFCKYYLETGNFPRGFPNSSSSEGHFNSGGHRLIAKAIHRNVPLSMNARFDAFHAN